MVRALVYRALTVATGLSSGGAWSLLGADVLLLLHVLLTASSSPDQLQAFGKYICYEWVRYNPGSLRLREFKVWAVGHRHLLGQGPSATEPIARDVILRQYCAPPLTSPPRRSTKKGRH